MRQAHDNCTESITHQRIRCAKVRSNFGGLAKRTTLDIDDDVLLAAKELPKAADKTAGKVISDLVRKSLTATPVCTAEAPKAIYGIRPFPRRGGIVTNDMINKIREREGI